jgi:hypothetical protein
MNAKRSQQRGASAIAIIIVLLVIGAAVYVGFQYLPQVVEAGTVDSILDSVEKAHEETPYRSADAVRDAIDKQLNVNQLEGLKDSVKVTDEGEAFAVEVNYERGLNLLYKQQKIPYEKTLTLAK